MKIGIGIPCFDKLPFETSCDYMRMMYSFGRRYPDHDFFLLTKNRSEQFRARNSIVQTAVQFGLDRLLFLDDDHVFSYRSEPTHESYDFLQKLLDHDKDIVGCLYYHRTGEYRPVLMKRSTEDGYTFLNDAEITGGLQEVDVQGGGCMLINMKIFDKITPPYFEPEMHSGEGQNYGTDIQLCRKAQDAGFSVWCDTSIVVGHVKQESEIVHADNRDSFLAGNMLKNGLAEDYMMGRYLTDYRKDVLEYTDLDWEGIVEHALHYKGSTLAKFDDYEDKRDYYRDTGISQLCRQCHFHSSVGMAQQGLQILMQFRRGFTLNGLDFGCGSAPIGFELLKRGHHMDFVDVDGAAAYEFLRWRVEKHGLEAGWEMGGPYQFMLFLDSIEHIEDWEGVLDNAIARLEHKGYLVTNYFQNHDYNNKEHISMDHNAVAEFLASRKMLPAGNFMWIKRDPYMGSIKTIEREEAQ